MYLWFLAIVDQQGGHTQQQRGLSQHYWPASPVAWGGGVLCQKGCPYVSIVVRAPHVFLCDHINQRVCFHIENVKSANQLCCEVKSVTAVSTNLIIMILRILLIQLMDPCVLNNCIVIFRCWWKWTALECWIIVYMHLSLLIKLTDSRLLTKILLKKIRRRTFVCWTIASTFCLFDRRFQCAE